MGDAADGYPGLPGWGAKSTAAVLSRMGIWNYSERLAYLARERYWRRALAGTLARERDRAFLFRTLATLRTDIPLFDSVDDFDGGAPRRVRSYRRTTRRSHYDKRRVRAHATASAGKDQKRESSCQSAGPADARETRR